MKTLQDIKIEDNHYMNYNEYVSMIREEAMVWIKHYRAEIKKYETLDKEYRAADLLDDRPACSRPDFTEEIMIYRGLIAGFKHFFNLDMED